jgi:hypothetical protein
VSHSVYLLVGYLLQNRLWKKKSVLVEEASCRYGDEFNTVEDADHISISRPKEKTSLSFYGLTRFLASISRITWVRWFRSCNPNITKVLIVV